MRWMCLVDVLQIFVASIGKMMIVQKNETPAALEDVPNFKNFVN